MSVFAQIIEGEADAAELAFVVAVILGAVGAVIYFTERAVPAALVATALTFLALGFVLS